MAVTVNIPTVMRKFTDGEAHVSAEGVTLKEVLADLEASHPGITKNVVDGENLYRFINVFVNDADARLNGGLSAAVNDGDTVRIIPAVAGG
jgi:sulfur-carrier protein